MAVIIAAFELGSHLLERFSLLDKMAVLELEFPIGLADIVKNRGAEIPGIEELEKRGTSLQL